MNIVFYKTSDERNRIIKTLTETVRFEGVFTTSYNTINPTLQIVSRETFDSNYCYIQETNRYYFIDKINIRRDGFYDLYLTLDVLMTYQDKILNLWGTVSQSKNSGLYLKNNSISLDARPQLKKYEFTDNFNHEGNIILSCSGFFKGV